MAGLRLLRKDVTKILDYLNQLLNFAKKMVGKKNIKTTPLYFAGIAGLRLEQQRNPQGYAKIMSKSKEALENSGFAIADQPRVISGQKETAYAWVNVNALEEKLP